MSRVRTVDHDRVREYGARHIRPDEIARRLDCSTSYVRLILKGKVGHNTQTQSRQDSLPLDGRPARMPAVDNEAIANDRSLYHSTVADPRRYRHDILKSGYNSSKIGKQITKGKWKGFAVYTLTLEERATCPLSCHHYRSCFGNSMQHAHRFAHGADLETRLIEEVHALGRKHPGGFAVRLHVLGDFYSVRYVQLWEMLLEEVPQFHAFGFSARWDCDRDPIAAALVRLVLKNWDRFAIRFSNAPIDECSTVSIEHPKQKPDDAIICPQQLPTEEFKRKAKSICCGDCTLCWQSKTRVAFIQH